MQQRFFLTLLVIKDCVEHDQQQNTWHTESRTFRSQTPSKEQIVLKTEAGDVVPWQTSWAVMPNSELNYQWGASECE